MSASSPDHSAAVNAPPVARNYVQLSPGSVAKIRNPILVVVFAIVTLGIYQLFWWYFANRELADYGRAKGTTDLGDNPTLSTLALFPGGLLVVPAIWTMFTTFQRVQAAQRLNGKTPLNGWLGLVIVLVISPVLIGYMQSGLNSAWSDLEPVAGSE